MGSKICGPTWNTELAVLFSGPTDAVLRMAKPDREQTGHQATRRASRWKAPNVSDSNLRFHFRPQLRQLWVCEFAVRCVSGEFPG